MTIIVEERLAALDTLALDDGCHPSFESGHCALELVAWLAGEPHSDSPKCVSPVLKRYVIRLNDRLPTEPRQQLKPFLPRLIGTAADGKDEALTRSGTAGPARSSRWKETRMPDATYVGAGTPCGNCGSEPR